MHPYSAKQEILKEIQKRGGWVNAHAHLDRAFSLTKKNYHLTNATLQEKWSLVDSMKRTSSVSSIYDRMAYTTEHLAKQGVVAIGSFIDVDDVVKDKAMKAADRVRQTFKRSVTFRFINQTLKGVLDKKAFAWFNEGASFVDIIGGLPGKDAGREEEHIDVIFTAARTQHKMVHVHVDQLNIETEKETELLTTKTKQYRLEHRVVAIHGISIAAQKKSYRQRLYKKMASAGVNMIACPSAWIDHKRTEVSAPSHNAVTPIDELVPSGVVVALGTDNIQDIYKPFSDGDMWTELRFILESCHYYDKHQLATIASTNGRRVLGIQ